MAFLFVDLNHFKEINDSFGHPAGDELLRQLGPRLTKAVGNQGRSFAWAGTSSAVVLMDADAERRRRRRPAHHRRDRTSPSCSTRSRRRVGREHRHRARPGQRHGRVGLDVVRRRRDVPSQARQRLRTSSTTRTIDGGEDQRTCLDEASRGRQGGPVRPSLPTPARPARPVRSWPWRRSCAGRTPSSVSCLR